MQLVSRKIEVALNAMQLLAMEGKLKRTEIAKKLGENELLAHSVLCSLSKAGFLVSTRSSIGGYELDKKATARKLSEVFAVFDKRYVPNPTRSDAHASERLGREFTRILDKSLTWYFFG